MVRKMKKLSFFLSVLFLTPVNLVFAQDQQIKQEAGNLTVQIIGIKNDSGDVKIGLFNTEESFNGKAEKFRGITVKAEKNKFVWSLENIPFGYYAIKAFHDEDRDDEVDTKFGIPKEGFGFSNNPSIFAGAPSYDKAKFLFNTDSLTVEIKLISF
jgi:uncharacterized protein (DUF2141 family)